jgi:hypothetical protein
MEETIYRHFIIKGELDLSNLVEKYRENTHSVIQSECAGYYIMPTPIFSNQDTFFKYKDNKIEPLFYNKYKRFLLEDFVFQNQYSHIEDQTQFLLLFETRISPQVWLNTGNGASSFILSDLNTNSPVLSIPERTSEAYAKPAIIEIINKKIYPTTANINVPQLTLIN